MEKLMNSEDLALNMIEDFEARGSEIIKTLGSAHKEEHDRFLVKVEKAKEAIAEKTKDMKGIMERAVCEVEKGKEIVAGGQRVAQEEYEQVQKEIDRMLKM
jgi:hypothetical protein